MIPSALKTLIYWINERETIRLNREGGRAVLSSDPLFREWRWCNVNRCHDRETRWIFKNVIEKHKTSDTLWFNLAIGRFINWSPTLADLGYFHTWDPKHFCEVIADRMERKEKVYTGAYMIRAGTGDDAKMPKHEYLCKRVFSPLWSYRTAVKSLRTCEQWNMMLDNVFGMGEFMKNQIITDMKYSNILPRKTTLDWTTFCLAGPGTCRGLNRLFGNPLRQSWDTDDANEKLQEVREELKDRVNCPSHLADLNNVANCLCEFDKYLRLTNGEGEPRSKYRPSDIPLP